MQPNQTSIPTAVLRKWKAAFEPEVPKEPKGERIKTIKWLMHEIELEVKDLR